MYSISCVLLHIRCTSPSQDYFDAQHLCGEAKENTYINDRDFSREQSKMEISLTCLLKLSAIFSSSSFPASIFQGRIYYYIHFKCNKLYTFVVNWDVQIKNIFILTHSIYHHNKMATTQDKENNRLLAVDGVCLAWNQKPNRLLTERSFAPFQFGYYIFLYVWAVGKPHHETVTIYNVHSSIERQMDQSDENSMKEQNQSDSWEKPTILRWHCLQKKSHR